MPRGISRSPNEKFGNRRRSNYSSPSKRSGPGPSSSRTMGRYSRSPHRSRSPPRPSGRPSGQHRSRSPRTTRTNIDSSHMAQGTNFTRTSRPPAKSQRRTSTTPPRKQAVPQKPLVSSKPIGGGGKRSSISPSNLRRKHSSPPTGGPSPSRRLEVASHREASRMNVNSGLTKHDYETQKGVNRQTLTQSVARKKEPRSMTGNISQTHSANVGADGPETRQKGGEIFRTAGTDRPDVFRESENASGTLPSHLLANGRGFRDVSGETFVSDHQGSSSPFQRERLEVKRYQDISFEAEGYHGDEVYHKYADEGPTYPLREEKQLLDERFRGSKDTGHPYDTEELKKITVDIRRNIPRDSEPIVRRIINPEEVILVRRPGEGSRPIFDRDEIRQSNLEREEEFMEKRVVAIVRERGRSRSPLQRLTFSQQSEMHENFKVHREGTFRQDEFPSRQSLSDRWQHDRKFGSSTSGEKLLVSVRPSQIQSKSSSYRSPIRDDLYREGTRGRSSYYEDEMTTTSGRDSDERHRDPYDPRRSVPTNPNDLRHSLMSRGRSFDLGDARARILERQEREPIHGHRMETLPIDKDRGDGYERFQLTVGSSWDRDKSREKWDGNGSGRTDKQLPNFAARRDRYQYKEWVDKPDMVPKGPSYFEHDTRGERGLEFRRGRGFRGLGRGNPFWGRGTFRGRGRGLPPPHLPRREIEISRPEQVSRLGKKSPHQWEHDMFDKVDVKSGNH